LGYGDNDKRYIGVMAQEVQKSHPEAVMKMKNGYLAVNYDHIGVKFRETPSSKVTNLRTNELKELKGTAPLP